MNDDDPIADALDMAPLPVPAKDPTAVVPVEDNKDYDYARENLYQVIETGANALDELAQIAQQSQHPRAYEVLGGLVKTLVDANKALMDLKKQNIDIKNVQNNVEDNRVQNNNIFVQSTAELQKMLSGLKNNGS